MSYSYSLNNYNMSSFFSVLLLKFFLISGYDPFSISSSLGLRVQSSSLPSQTKTVSFSDIEASIVEFESSKQLAFNNDIPNSTSSSSSSNIEQQQQSPLAPNPQQAIHLLNSLLNIEKQILKQKRTLIETARSGHFFSKKHPNHPKKQLDYQLLKSYTKLMEQRRELKDRLREVQGKNYGEMKYKVLLLLKDIKRRLEFIILGSGVEDLDYLYLEQIIEKLYKLLEVSQTVETVGDGDVGGDNSGISHSTVTESNDNIIKPILKNNYTISVDSTATEIPKTNSNYIPNLYSLGFYFGPAINIVKSKSCCQKRLTYPSDTNAPDTNSESDSASSINSEDITSSSTSTAALGVLGVEGEVEGGVTVQLQTTHTLTEEEEEEEEREGGKDKGVQQQEESQQEESEQNQKENYENYSDFGFLKKLYNKFQFDTSNSKPLYKELLLQRPVYEKLLYITETTLDLVESEIKKHESVSVVEVLLYSIL